jgi:hypothetical protein
LPTPACPLRRPLRLPLSKFNATLVESVEETIGGVLGEKVAEAFFAYLANAKGVRKDQLASRPEIWFSTLDEIFGLTGKTLGKRIVGRLYLKLGLEFVTSNTSLVDYVYKAAKELVE